MKNQKHSVLSSLLGRYREKYKLCLKIRDTTDDPKEYLKSKIKLEIYGEEIRILKKEIQETQSIRAKEENKKFLEWLAKWPIL